jgi:endothelin-converting enzyme/putative endopeptidase
MINRFDPSPTSKAKSLWLATSIAASTLLASPTFVYAQSASANAQVSSQASSEKLGSGIELEYLNKSIAAGDDFYERINFGWLENTEIPDDQSNYGSFSKLDDDAKAAIRKIIEAAAADENATGPAQQVGNLYRSYMNVDARNKAGIQPVEPMLEKVASASDKSEWMRVAGELSKIGVGQIFGGYIGPDVRKSTEYTVYVSQGGTTLPDRDYYLVDNEQNRAVLAEFETYIHDMMVFAGHPNPAAAAQDVIALETLLAGAQWTRIENRDPVARYNKKSNEEIKSLLSNMDWAAYLEGSEIPEREFWIVGQPSFFQASNEIFKAASLEQLKAFLLFSVIDNQAPFLSEEIEKRHFDFHATVLSGIEAQKPLWRRGVELCNGLLGMPVGQLYVEENFPPEAKTRMDELVKNLRKAFAKRIEGLDWMGDGTKKQALEKLSMFTAKIGYPDKWKDYSSVTTSADDLIDNLLAVAKFEHQYELNKLGQPIDRTEWFMSPQTINAYYNPTMNEIVFPAAILQPPFFDLNADDAVNYGGIGAVIGHELSHGFDDKGSQYDGNGNLRDWWTPEDREEFMKRANQLVAQYSNYYPFEDMAVQGELTLGENIGDLGGLNVAYAAYQESLGGNEAVEIDGLSGNERFFAGWAQVWRRKYREQELRKRLLTDPHSPSRYRCNGIVANMDVFYETFGVKDGDIYIKPEDRVKIW